MRRRDDGGEAVSEELRAALDEAVERLGDAEREAVVLRYYRGLSVEQVAAEVGASRGAVRQRLSRAVRRLRGELGGSVSMGAVGVAGAGVPAGLAGKVVAGVGLKGAAAVAGGGGVVGVWGWVWAVLAGAVTASVVGGPCGWGWGRGGGAWGAGRGGRGWWRLEGRRGGWERRQ